jgi:hypothetical protein
MPFLYNSESWGKGETKVNLSRTTHKRAAIVVLNYIPDCKVEKIFPRD